MQKITSSTPFTWTTETRISICILIWLCSHDHIMESEFRAQLCYFTLLEFKTLSWWCLLNSLNFYSFFSGCKQEDRKDSSEAKKIIAVGSCIHSIRLFAMEVNSEDYCRCVCSFAGGILLQQAAVGEAKIMQQFLHCSSVLDSPSCPSRTSRNAKFEFTDECGFKTTSETGLQPRFKSALYSLCEHNNPH